MTDRAVLRAKRETLIRMAEIEDAMIHEVPVAVGGMDFIDTCQRRARALRALAEKAMKPEVKPLAEGQTLPSPDEVMEAQSGAGGWTKAQLAEWGIRWPPPRGWRKDLEQRWRAEQRQGRK